MRNPKMTFAFNPLSISLARAGVTARPVFASCPKHGDFTDRDAARRHAARCSVRWSRQDDHAVEAHFLASDVLPSNLLAPASR